MRHLILLVLPLGMTAAGAADLWGQGFVRQAPPQQNYVYRAQPNVLQQPKVSPYIGLLRRGNGTGNLGLNYFSIVRPEIQMRETLDRQQAEQNRLAQENLLLQQRQQMMIDPATQLGANPITGAARTIRPTGHATSRMNLQGRFGTR